MGCQEDRCDTALVLRLTGKSVAHRKGRAQANGHRGQGTLTAHLLQLP